MSSGTIKGFYVTNDGSFVCRYTMFWIGETGVTLPPDPAFNPNLSQTIAARWSSSFPKKSVEIKECSDLGYDLSGTHHVPRDGAEVWMRVDVQAGNSVPSTERFVYSPTSKNYAQFSVSGTTLSVGLTFDGLYQTGP